MMHTGMLYDPIQGQGHETLKVGNLAIFKMYLLPHYRCELANDSIVKLEEICKFGPARFLIFGLVFVACDFGVCWTCKVVKPVRRSRLSAPLMANFYLKSSYL